MSSYIPPRRLDDNDPNAPHRCTVTPQCKNPAVIQWIVNCGDCELTHAEVDERVGRKQAELQRHHDALALVRAQGNAADPAVNLAITMGEQRVAALNADLQALTAAYELVREAHTHPMFACAKHREV